MKTRLFALAAALCAVLLLSPAAGADSPPANVINDVIINGFDWVPWHPASDFSSVWVADGVTMVPAEEFFQVLAGPVRTDPETGAILPGGAQVRWAEDGSNILTVTWYDHTLTLTPGKDTMTADGREVKLPVPARFEAGRFCVPLRPVAEALGCTVKWTGIPEVSYPKKQVKVDSLEALFNAVAPDTEIFLEPGEYSLGAMDWTKIDNPYVKVDFNVFDTATGLYNTGTVWEVVIRGVRDLTIQAGASRVSTPWAYADVWKFEDCDRIRVEGGIAVHDVESGYCAGNCVELENCHGVSLTGMVMDGSGAYGLCTYGCEQVYAESCIIRNCTYGALSLWNTRDVELWECQIAGCRDCFGLIGGAESRDVRIQYCTFAGNSANALTAYEGQNLVFGHCTFRENTFGQIQEYGWQSSGGAAFYECTWLE